MMAGTFITVEGADGAGKTTQIDYIESWLQQRNIDVVRTREPGGTGLGELLREILLNRSEVSISNDAELLLIFAARQQHLDEVIIPALGNGKWVLSDRFTDATYAYQGGGRGISEQRILNLEQWVQGVLRPDLTLMFDVEVELGISRSHSRGQERDRFEMQMTDFKRAVRKSYLARAEKYPDRIKLVDASASIQCVQKHLNRLLDEFIDQRC